MIHILSGDDEGTPGEGAARRADLDSTVASLYESLRELARRAMIGGSSQRAIDPTELVHECYLKLARTQNLGSLNRAEFLALAATAIRTLLVDRAREMATLKRGGALRRITLDGGMLMQPEPVDLVEMDAALTKLGKLDSRMARVVEMRFFGGLDTGEVATALNIAPRTVENEWAMARAWLHRELGK